MGRVYLGKLHQFKPSGSESLRKACLSTEMWTHRTVMHSAHLTCCLSPPLGQEGGKMARCWPICLEVLIHWAGGSGEVGDVWVRIGIMEYNENPDRKEKSNPRLTSKFTQNHGLAQSTLCTGGKGELRSDIMSTVPYPWASQVTQPPHSSYYLTHCYCLGVGLGAG